MEARSQFAALCYRIQNNKVRILLVTSRRTQRWILPKGWPSKGLTPQQSALREAREEAGVRGALSSLCVGHYWYLKDIDTQTRLRCIVAVFPIEVRSLLTRFPECEVRQRQWFSRKKASRLVEEKSLRQIIREFDPFALP